MQLTIHHSHPWDVTPQQAREIQNELRKYVVCIDRFDPKLTRVAGVDVGFENHGKITRAAVALLSFPDLERLESSIACKPTTCPYFEFKKHQRAKVIGYSKMLSLAVTALFELELVFKCISSTFMNILNFNFAYCNIGPSRVTKD